MTNENSITWSETPTQPFGVVLTSHTPDADLFAMPIDILKEQIAEHRIVVLRGFAAPEGDKLTEFGRLLGDVLEWEFGAVNNLQVKPDAKNYLYTQSAVPFHWDGAFVGRIPHFIVFHCEDAPESEAGGETLFTDTTMLLDAAPEEKRKLWEGLDITYSTQKVVHYGGQFTSTVIAKHPNSGETVIRYAEPVEDLNPVMLEIPQLNDTERAEFLADMKQRLYDPQFCYAHAWQQGDIVIADNHALLHGRYAFQTTTNRHIRRVNVL